jgi:hypothetical protein
MQSAAVLEKRAQVLQIREARFEAYQAHEYQRRLYDEITDTAERVRAPIVHTQEFALTIDGLVSERGELLRPVIAAGLAEAQRMAMINPDWCVEVTRRMIDLQEYDELETLAAAGEGSGAIVSYWLIPDAVRVGDSNLPGYNRERLKMFTRIAMPTAKGLAIRYHSYDGSYMPGVQAMDEALGFVFDASRTSEQIAGERRYIGAPVEDIDVLDELLRQAYDGTLARDFGGEWFGGRPPLPMKEDIVAFIARQHGLLNEHMDELAKVFAIAADPHERNKLMEPHRYNFAAAIDDLIHGKLVTSASDAGDNARSEGRNLDGDCPTGSDNATESQLEKLGFKTARKQLPRIWVVGDCRTCEREKAIDIGQCGMCLDCENVHNNQGNTGLDRVMKEAAERRARAERAAASRRKQAQTTGKMALKQTRVVAEAAK